MKNIPRIYLNADLKSGIIIAPDIDTAHYLTRVMRIPNGGAFLAFHDGDEFNATVNIGSGKRDPVIITIGDKTAHCDPSNGLTLAFAPIKQARLEEMISMGTQMGIARFIPVITDHTTAKHINWDRMKKIMAEAAEQSGRNRIPALAPVTPFDDFVATHGKNIIYADERFAHDDKREKETQVDHAENSSLLTPRSLLFIGPEGGFSKSEFDALQTAGGRAITLGETTLRAETAAVVAIAKVLGI